MCKKLSVSNIAEENINDKEKSFDAALNICTLKPFGQEEDNDLSYCSDSVLEDVCDDSIVSDQYFITPGKQRIFDMRLANPSIRSKTFVSSAPSMDRIEESITPNMPKVHNSPLATFNDGYCSPSIAEDNLNTSDTVIINDLSTVDYNQTKEIEFESTTDVLKKNNLKNLVECESMNTSTISENSCIEKESTFTNNKLSVIPFEVLDKTPDDLITEVNKVDLDNTINVEPIIISETNIVNDYNDGKNLSITLKARKNSNNISVVNTTYGDTCIDKLFTNSYDESTNKTNQTEDLSDADAENSPDIMSNTIINDTSLQPNEFNINNSLKDLTKLDNSYLNTTEPISSNAVHTPLEGISDNTRPYLDIVSDMYKMSTDNSSICCNDFKINESESNDQTQENIFEPSLYSDVSFNSVMDKNNSVIDNSSPMKSNLSVIIENRTLEESACNDVEQNNEVSNTLNSTRNYKECLTIEHSMSEVQISIQNETDNNNKIIEMEPNPNGDILLNSLISDNINLNHNNTDISDFATVELTSETKDTNLEQHVILNNDIQQPSLLNTSENSLEHYRLEKLFNFNTDKTVKQFEYNTPKIQKLLDFSIVQQTPTDVNQSKKQKLLNFSIVEQTPISKSIQQTSLNQTLIAKDTLIDFSSIDQIQGYKPTDQYESPNKDIFTKSSESPFNNEFLNNLSNVSAPDFEYSMGESMKTNLSNQSKLAMTNTLNDPDLNLSTSSDEMSKSKMNTDLCTQEILGSESINDNNCSIKKNEHSSFLDKTIVQNDHLEISVTAENTKFKPTYLPIPTSKKIENFNSSDSLVHSNKQLVLNANECVIVDFSIVEQSSPQATDLNTDQNNESNKTNTNFIDMSTTDTKSYDQVLSSSENSVLDVISDNKTDENNTNSNSDDINKTTIRLDESKCLYNDPLLTDIEMDDVSILMGSPRKSSISESFHSIELDNVNDDNKRKMPVQEPCNIEKKMKVETEEVKTPMSMLYKIKNMFRSNEKPSNYESITKERKLKSDALSNIENKYNFNPTASLKMSEVLTRSKIPCIVTDKSIIKNNEFDNSSLLNDSIKPKRVIPKFTGVPVLSDVSNSSNRKCPGSRIPSKFNK